MQIEAINAMTAEQFVGAVGWVFEHSPWVAERTSHKRPFASVAELSDRMNTTVREALRDEQLALLCAHPDLGTRMQVSSGSASEQMGAGLNQLTESEYTELVNLNNAYRLKFGFPFLSAVKGRGKTEIIAAMRARSGADPEIEFEEALRQVFRIARFRLEDL